MRNRIDSSLLAGAVAFACVATGASLSDRWLPGSGAVKPARFYAAGGLNAGELGWGEEAKVSVTLRNDHDAPVKIVGIGTDCGCTDATVVSRTVPPAGETTLSANFQADRGDGPVRKRITVDFRILGVPSTADEPETSRTDSIRRLVVPLTATVVPQFRLAPAALTFQEGKPGQATLEVTPVTAGSARIHKVTVGSAGLSAKKAGISAGSRSDDARWLMKYDPSRSEGYSSSTVTVQVVFTPSGGGESVEEEEFVFLPVDFSPVRLPRPSQTTQ